MFLTYLILAISSSIDSFGIGITYGIKNTRITFVAKLVVFLISLCISTLSISVGKFIYRLFPPFFCNIIGFLILILMGLFIIFQALRKSKKTASSDENSQKRIYNLFINSFGITIQIIKNPINSDLDNSKNIDGKEALYLGFALSLDSLCIGIGNAMLGMFSFIFTMLVAFFQLIFLSLGLIFGNKLKKVTNIPDNIWSIIAGILLIFIGISKLI